jgi:hypothetical protein
MTSKQREDLKNQQSRLLVLVDQRQGMRNNSQQAITTDSEILVVRNLIRSYEALKRFER